MGVTESFRLAKEGTVVAVSGGRDVGWGLDHLQIMTSILIVFSPIAAIWHGGQVGIDEGAAFFASRNHIPQRAFLPEPTLFDQHAAHALVGRTQEMIDELAHSSIVDPRRVLLVAFPGNEGTDNAVKFAIRRRVPIVDLRGSELLRIPLQTPPRTR